MHVRDLSVREQQVLQGIVHGLTNKSIARQNNITEQTVKVHVKTILRKLQVRTRVQAVVWALRQENEMNHQQRDELFKTILDKYALDSKSIEVPSAIAIALDTRRPELLELAPRNLSREEVKKLYDVIAMLMRQQEAMREYAHALIDKTIEPWTKATAELIGVTKKFQSITSED